MKRKAREWLPPTFAYPWGMVFDLEAVPAVLSNLSELTLYCPVMAMPSELEDNPMRYCGLSLDSLICLVSSLTANLISDLSIAM